MVRVVRFAGERLKELGSLLWRCFYSVTLTVFGTVGLALIPQATESLRLVSQPGWTFPLFLISVASWSLAAWYSARLTLGRVFDGSSLIDRSNSTFVMSMREWLPRTLGVLPGTVVTRQFIVLGEPVQALACAATTFALGMFVLKRRNWFATHFHQAHDGRDNSMRFVALQRRTLRTVVSAIALSFALLAAIWWKPVAVTAVITAPVLLCFAFASWILFGDLVLIYFFKQARLPSMAAAPLLLFIVFSPWNDNHGIALIQGDGGPVLRRSVDSHLDAWLAARARSGELTRERPFPIFLVAAEGGGIRAAYWSAIVLAKLQDDSGGRFGRHLFALSGVSGGSLANAVFVALMADAQSGPAPDCARGAASDAYQRCVRAVLRRDFLSPALGYLLYPDMLQRFLPFSMPGADRALAMEQAWQHGWQQATGSDRLAQRFDRLWQNDAALALPSLLLNATMVAGGNRIIASDLLIDGRFPDAYDAFDPLLDLKQMSLATAVHNSARFSYVSPAGTVYGCWREARLAPCAPGLERHAWGRVIDGGYFENSGVESVRDLLFAMTPVLQDWAKRGYKIAPLVIVISNSPGAIAPPGRLDPDKAAPEEGFLSELLAPPLGLFNTRAARATFAVTAQWRDMAVLDAQGARRFVWFGMHTENYTPLGWALSGHTFDGIDRLLTPPQVQQLPFAAVLERLPAPPLVQQETTR